MSKDVFFSLEELNYLSVYIFLFLFILLLYKVIYYVELVFGGFIVQYEKAVDIIKNNANNYTI